MNESLARLQILVVDDNEYMRGVIRTVLRALGITQVHEAESGAAAIGVLRETAIDIVFVDWMMQPMSGPELVQFLRSSDTSPNPYIPIVMVTAHSEVRNIKAARDIGITEFLAKPVTAKSIYERIVAIIEKPRPFIRAKEYFGPDRRRQIKEFKGSEKRT
jgi:two-component system, chemotaxis family, chemotaxis protein CheY